MRMNKLRNRIGMTMAELLIVVAIIVVLAGVAFIAVNNYQRSLGQLERDGIAKEIFVAAQNHLTVAYGEGYLGLEEPTDNKAATDNPFGTWDSSNETYSIAFNGGVVGNTQRIFDQMLPFGSIDETVRAGGGYIIRYQKATGLVLDVFYWTRSGSPDRFNYTGSDYSAILSLGGDEDEQKAERRDYDGSIIGWYGGTGAATLPTITLDRPIIEVINRERLYVKINDPNNDKSGAALRLIIHGETSGKTHYLDIYTSQTGPNSSKSNYEIELDNITTDIGAKHFCQLGFHDGGSNDFYPGENITVQAVAYSTSSLTNTMYSNKVTRNSLFADGTTTTTAYIRNIRHLENLDARISNLDKSNLSISNAVQRNDLNWKSDDNGYWSNSSRKITLFSGTAGTETAGRYFPIEPDYPLEYNGDYHSISSIITDTNRVDAGLFGSVSSVSSISNLELLDFSVAGTDSAGALAGSLSNCKVTNVLARNSTNAATTNITATSGAAGGLIGSATDCTVKYSAAALIVNGSTAAGGLIGTASENSGSMLVAGCYSGGHTDPNTASYYIGGTASYDDNTGVLQNGIYNVRTTGTGGVAGGLIGVSGPTVINNSYSTCSVNGTKAGGFIGSGSGNITNSYCTGLVGGTTIGSFAGEYSGTAGTCNYFEIINEIPPADSSAYTYLLPVYYSGSGVANDYLGISALDATEGSYNIFVGNTWKTARAYDPVLVQYYQGKYNLKSIPRLDSSTPANYFVNTHYGDWPAPEIFFLNTPAA